MAWRPHPGLIPWQLPRQRRALQMQQHQQKGLFRSQQPEARDSTSKAITISQRGSALVVSIRGCLQAACAFIPCCTLAGWVAPDLTSAAISHVHMQGFVLSHCCTAWFAGYNKALAMQVCSRQVVPPESLKATSKCTCTRPTCKEGWCCCAGTHHVRKVEFHIADVQGVSTLGFIEPPRIWQRH